MKYTFVIITLLILLSCNRDVEGDVGTVLGYKPIYINKVEAQKINSGAAVPIEQGGKFAYFNNKMYMVEQKKGIHIINYTNPASPVKERFISIPLCLELTLKNGIIFTNNGSDLVSLDISNNTVVVLDREPNIFEQLLKNSTPNQGLSNEYFECVNPEKGYVIGWEKVNIVNPKCRLR